MSNTPLSCTPSSGAATVRLAVPTKSGCSSGAPIFVSSFNTRTGAVMPLFGDYTASMIGTNPSPHWSNVQQAIDFFLMGTGGSRIVRATPFVITDADSGYIIEATGSSNIVQGVLTPAFDSCIVINGNAIAKPLSGFGAVEFGATALAAFPSATISVVRLSSGVVGVTGNLQ